MKKHINKFISTSAFEAEKEQLNQLKHFVAYDAEAKKIYLKRKDIVAYDITFNVTPDDATIKYSINSTAYDQTATNGELISVNRGSTIYYKVSKNGYTEKSSNLLVQKSETITVSLDIKQFTFTINPTPSDATVKLNNEVKKSITVDYNTEVTWSVEKTGYVTQSGTTTITDDETKDVTLVLNSYDVKFNVTPSDAVIKYSIDEETYDQTATNNVPFKVNHGSTVYYQVSKEGYDTITSSKLINKNETIDVNVSVTNHNVTFNVTPDGATIKYSINSTAYDQTATNGSPITVAHGSIVNYKITKLGYNDKIDSITINKDETITVSLDIKQFTFTINPTPSDATVKLNNEVKKSITVDYNTEVTWSVEKTGYTTQSGKTTVTDNETKDITLVIKSYDVKFNVTPDDATIKYSIDEETYDQTATNNVPFKVNHGSTVYYQISKEGYTTVTNSKEIVQEETIDVNITVTNHNVTFNVTPSDSIIYYSINEESYNKTATNNKPIIVAYGSTVYYKVTKVGYNEKLGNIVVDGDETITVSLDIKQFTFTINPTPSDATVKLNNEVKKSITVDYNTEVTWSVEKTGYITQSGTTTVIKNETKDVTLVIKSYDVKFNVTTENATINYSIDKETYDQTATNNVSFKVNHGSTVYYKIMADGYENESNSKLITQNETIEVSLMPLRYEVKFNVKPSDATIKYSIDNQTYSETATNNVAFMVIHGSTVYYQITREGYNEVSDSILITKAETIETNLIIKQFTFTVNPTPSDATVTLNGEVKKSITVDYNTEVTWSVEKTGYTTQSGKTTVTDNETKDITLVIKSYDVKFNVTPSDAVIKYSIDEETYDQTATNNVPFKVNHGSTVYYQVSKEGYDTITSSKLINKNETIDVNITVTNYNVTFNVTPSNAVIKYSIDEETYEQTTTNGNPILVQYNSILYYQITKDGYVTEANNILVQKDETITVSLDVKQFTFTINPTPSDAIVTLNGEVKNSITVDYNTEVTWSVEKEGYVTQSGEEIIVSDMTKTVGLTVKSYDVVFTVTPTDVEINYSIDNQSYDQYIENGAFFKVNHGQTIYYRIIKENYQTIEDSRMITQDETISVDLQLKQYTFSITTEPEDAIVIMNSLQRNEITVNYGTNVTWSVEKEGYDTQSGIEEITDTINKHIVLNIKTYGVRFNVTPTNAIINYSINSETYDNQISNNTDIRITSGDTIYYKIVTDGYYDYLGNLLVDNDETIQISLTPFTYAILEYTTTNDNEATSLFSNQEIMNNIVKDCRLGDTNEKVTTYNYTFPQSGIHMVKVSWKDDATNFNNVFDGCTNLTSIPSDLFSTNTAVTSFDSTFNECSGLTSIPTELFSNCPNVTSFTYTFLMCSKLTSIPEGIFSANTAVTRFDGTFNSCALTEIPENMFSNCLEVDSFVSTFAHNTNLASIGSRLFYNNSKVTSFEACFYNCVSLSGIPNGLFANKTEVTNFNETFSACESLTNIGNSAFDSCSRISEFSNTFSGCTNITTIGNLAFNNCSNIKTFNNVIDTNKLISIGDYAFANCTSVSGFDYIFSFSTNLQTLGNGVFSGCSNVTTFSNAFYGCTSLINVSSNLFAACDNVTDFSYVFYQCEALTEVPTKLFADKQLANDFNMAFASCINLHKIGDGAFSGCTSITNFDDMFISSLDLNEIGNSAFEGCTSLIDFSTALPAMSGEQLNITKIGDSAFKNCIKMTTFTTSINFNNNTNLTSIGASAFENCSSLTTFQDAFEGCVNLTTIGAYAFKGCSSVTSFLNAFYGCQKLTEIQEGLFSGCTKVTTFDSAFLNCSELQTIGINAFDSCSAVTSFTSTFEGCVNLTTIGAYAFNNCQNIETFESTFTDCTEITTIGDYAFNNCSVVSSFKNTFTCNSTLQSIGSYAFANCVGISDCSGLFSGYTALTTVGDGVFSGCTYVSTFESLFSNCSSLISVGGKLFDAITRDLRSYKSMFNGCKALTTLDENVFYSDSRVLVNDVSYMFNNCTSLKSVPETLFDKLTYISDASFTFANSGIETLPLSLFKYNVNINTFKGTFMNCSKLTNIPSGLFSTNTAVTSFANTFLGCSSLTSIPDDLFSTNTAVTEFIGTFGTCVNLTTIPSGLFRNNTAVTTFQGTFNSCGLTSIPSGLFHNSPNVTSFESTFSNNQALLSIPDELFVGCPNVTSFEGTFSSDKSISSIPDDLFSINTAVTNFRQVFQACTSLKTIPNKLFAENTAVTNFSYSFYNCSELTGAVPKDNDGNPIYMRSGSGKRGYEIVTDHSRCFYGCTKLENYGNIPEDWK